MDIRETALRYLEHRDRTEKEMRSRLAEKGFGPDEADETLKWLKEFHYIDDAAYGVKYLRYGFAKGRGIARVKKEMSDKGLAPEDIEKAIFMYEDEYETDIIEDEAKRAFEQGEKTAAGGSGEKTAAKVGRRLSSLGYPQEIIYKVVGLYLSER